jgi:hypothetical protein
MRKVSLLFATALMVLVSIAANRLYSQFSLRFNRVLLVDVSSGTVTVPANMVWKVEATAVSGGIRYGMVNTSYSSETWSVNNPNPCNGATSGSSGTLPRLRRSLCPTANNVMVINGTRTRPDVNKPLWLPAGTTVSIVQSLCTNTTSYAAATPHYTLDETVTPNVTLIECEGAINPGVVPNSILVSIIEFEIVP